jgi:hypothetical protein
MTPDQKGVMARASALALEFLGAEKEPLSPCCREDRLWRVYSRCYERKPFGRLEGALRFRRRYNVAAVSLFENESGGLTVRVLPREPLNRITVTVGFSNPELSP